MRRRSKGFHVLFHVPHAMLLSSKREHLTKSRDDTLVTVGDHDVLSLVHNIFEDLHRLIIVAQWGELVILQVPQEPNVTHLILRLADTPSEHGGLSVAVESTKPHMHCTPLPVQTVGHIQEGYFSRSCTHPQANHTLIDHGRRYVAFCKALRVSIEVEAF